MTRIRSLLAFMFALGSVVSIASADYWSPWISEEDNGRATWCSEWNQGATGIGCSGSYCDLVRLLCQTLPSGVSLEKSTDYWSEYFSEEDDGIGLVVSGGWYGRDGDTYHVCNFRGASAGIVNGMKCRGAYCDDVAIQCDIPTKTVNGVKYAVGGTNCSWSAWRSEEDGSVTFGTNRFITGAQCRGGHCDDMRVYVCTFDGTKLVAL